MVEITEKDWDTSLRNSHIQDAEKLFFKFPWFINFQYKKPFASNILYLNHVSLIEGDATDKDTSNDVFLTTGISGRYNATVISRISSSIINPPVLKFADADPGNGNGGHQYGAGNHNNANGNCAAYHIDWNNMIANGGNHGGGIGNGNGGNHNIGIGNGYGFGPIGILIHRTEVYSSGRIVRPIIFTNIFAYDYNSWTEFSLAVRDRLLHLIGHENDGGFEVDRVMGFGQRGAFQTWQFYRPLSHSWNVVKWLITDVLLYKAMFDDEPFLLEMPYQNGIVGTVEGGAFQALEIMDWFAPVQVYGNGGDEDGNGNGSGVSDGGNGNGDDGENDDGVDGDDDGSNGNGVDGDDDGGNGNGVDGDDDVGNGNGVDGDDCGGNGNGFDGDDHGGNGNGVDVDGAKGNRVNFDDHGLNDNGVDGADGGHGSGNDGDDGGSGSGNGGNFRGGSPGLLICCSMVLSFSLALAILANRNK